MKRIISILIASLFVAALAALAEAPQFSPFDYVPGETANGTYLVYSFPDIRLYLPMEWKGKITVEQGDDGIAFYQTDSYERYREEGIPGGGFLFELCASGDEGFRELPAWEYLGYSENAGLHFYLALPSDYPAYPDDAVREEYDAMAGQIGVVAEKARIAPSLNFYPGESTDAGMS